MARLEANAIYQEGMVPAALPARNYPKECLPSSFFINAITALGKHLEVLQSHDDSEATTRPEQASTLWSNSRRLQQLPGQYDELQQERQRVMHVASTLTSTSGSPMYYQCHDITRGHTCSFDPITVVGHAFICMKRRESSTSQSHRSPPRYTHWLFSPPLVCLIAQKEPA